MDVSVFIMVVEVSTYTRNLIKDILDKVYHHKRSLKNCLSLITIIIIGVLLVRTLTKTGLCLFLYLFWNFNTMKRLSGYISGRCTVTSQGSGTRRTYPIDSFSVWLHSYWSVEWWSSRLRNWSFHLSFSFGLNDLFYHLSLSYYSSNPVYESHYDWS